MPFTDESARLRAHQWDEQGLDTICLWSNIGIVSVPLAPHTDGRSAASSQVGSPGPDGGEVDGVPAGFNQL